VIITNVLVGFKSSNAACQVLHNNLVTI